MKTKFKIYYPIDHVDHTLAGEQYKVGGEEMLVMNNSGIFFVYCGKTYYPSITKLSDKIGNYDVVFSNVNGFD